MCALLALHNRCLAAVARVAPDVPLPWDRLLAVWHRAPFGFHTTTALPALVAAAGDTHRDTLVKACVLRAQAVHTLPVGPDMDTADDPLVAALATVSKLWDGEVEPLKVWTACAAFMALHPDCGPVVGG